MQKYPHLFSPIEIAGHTYKNRILVAPMIFGFLPLGGEELAERVYRITEEKAKGGSAEVVVGEVPINFEEGAITVGTMFPAVKGAHYRNKSGHIFEAYKEYADRIKKHDAIALIEIFHGGITSAFGKTDKHPWGPVAFTREDGVVVEAFDAEKIKKVCDEFATCADFMKAAGFDGVLIHGGHGYLFTQFLSPATNTRMDEYGGSIENRGRFPREIFKTIREKMGPDFIIELRIDGSENVEGGQSKEDTAAFCSTLDGLVDIIHITAGRHLDSYNTHTFTSHYDPHGINVEDAAFVKKRTRIPVAVVGGINDPEFAEKIIADGKVDFVSLGRQIIADPEFAKKAEEGREDEIRRCIRCYHCYGSRIRRVGDRLSGFSRPEGAMFAGWRCSINPVASNEVEISKMPEPKGIRNVLVVGGGPAGMQAAITAFDRGHKVTLVEKGGSLGGILCLTDIDVHKTDLKNFKDLLIREVGRRDIDVLLDTEITPAYLVDQKHDAVILAIGATPTLPDIPGLDSAMHTLDVYKSDAGIGKKVIMVGGGLAGCETAIHLADNGHEVTIIEMLENLAYEIGGMPHDAVMDQIKKRSINVKAGTKCIEITSHGVTVEKASGETETIEGDTIVHSLGMEAKRTEAEGLKAAAGDAEVFEVGDCVRGAKVFEAIGEGFMAAMKIV